MAERQGTVESLALNGLFNDTYAGRRVLVTGHTGFKGSWLCLWLTTLGARVTGLALSPDTQPSHWSLLDLKKVEDLRVDLRDAAAVRKTLDEVQPEIVFHLAAQALVRRGYREPEATFQTNVIGLLNLLQAIRTCPSVRAVINATTDKVYLEQTAEAGYGEDHPLGGHDPYSTSKACAELVSACYRKSYFAEAGSTRIATARAGNVIGGGDWSEDRLIPDLMRAAATGSMLKIRNPDAIRPWQHVLDPLSGYLRLGQGLLAGDAVEGAWNFGPAADATLPVRTLIARMLAAWPGLRSETDSGPHPHEAAILRLDCSKARRELGWRPVWDADSTLQHTSDWYRSYFEHGRLSSATNLLDFIHDARDAGLNWAA